MGDSGLRSIRISFLKTKTPYSLFFLCCLTLFLASGCASSGLFGSEKSAGLSVTKADALSRLAVESRAGYMGQPLDLIPRPQRQAVDPEKQSIPPSLALRGKNLNTSVNKKFEYALFLEKASYSTGYLEVTYLDDSNRKETWPIIAFDNVGKHDSIFEYIYVVSSPDGIQYLIINGGDYKSGTDTFGIEGTLIKPNTGDNYAEPEKVLKIDFGFNFQIPPAYINEVDSADDEADAIEKGIKTIQSLKDKIAKTEEELSVQKSIEVPEDKERKQREKIMAIEKELFDLQNSLTYEIKTTQIRLMEYADLRMKLSKNYASFNGSNQYTWMNNDQQAKYKDTFYKIQDIDAVVEASLGAFADHATDWKGLQEKYSEMRDLIQMNANFDKP